MVAKQVQKRLVFDKGARAENGMCVTARLGLGHKGQPRAIALDQPGVALLVARPDHNADVIDAGPHCLADDQAEDRTLCAMLVKERLHGKVALIFPGRRDYRFLYSHRTSIPAGPLFRLEASSEIGSSG
jgi:hypothetical protein